MSKHWLLQSLMGRGFAQIRLHAEHQHQIFIWINTVSLGHFHQAVDNGTGLGAFHTVTERPVFLVDYEGSDCCSFLEESFSARQNTTPEGAKPHSIGNRYEL